jgi:enolase
MAKALSRFTIEPGDDGYTLHIEDDGGETLELTATAEQLDIIAEAIEDQLEEDVEEIDVAE